MEWHVLQLNAFEHVSNLNRLKFWGLLRAGTDERVPDKFVNTIRARKVPIDVTDTLFSNIQDSRVLEFLPNLFPILRRVSMFST